MPKKSLETITKGKQFYAASMLNAILARPILPVQLYYYLVAEELLVKSKDKIFRVKLNNFIGTVRYEALQTIEHLLLKQFIYSEELGHIRMTARRMGILNNQLNRLISSRHSGSLKSPYVPDGYQIAVLDKANTKYEVVIEKTSKFKLISYKFTQSG